MDNTQLFLDILHPICDALVDEYRLEDMNIGDTTIISCYIPHREGGKLIGKGGELVMSINKIMHAVSGKHGQMVLFKVVTY